QITVTGTTAGEQASAFNPFRNVDFADSEIKFDSPDGYQTGDRLTYSSGDGNAIPGLTSGQAYYVIVVDSSTIRLAATPGDATAGTFIAFGTFPTLTAGSITVPITNINLVTDAIEYAFDTGLTDGQSVTYTGASGQAIGGLISGHTYTVSRGGDPN